VVISELPPGRETLLLRLMGSQAVRRAALAELSQMPDVDPEALRLRRLVASLRHTMKGATNISQEEREEFMTTAWAEFERYEDQLRKEGRKEGRREGHKEGRQQALRENIFSLCKVLRIELTPAQREVVNQMDGSRLESLRTYLEEHRAWPTG
jgi:predicted transposase YdaD